MKVTAPVGVVVPLAVTVAVNVTEAPEAEGLEDEVTLVVEAVVTLVSLPDKEPAIQDRDEPLAVVVDIVYEVKIILTSRYVP